MIFRSHEIMKKSLFAALICAAAFCTAHAAEFFKDGRLLFKAIAIPEKPSPAAAHAARELIYHINKMTGDKITVIRDRNAKPGGKYIFIGSCMQNASLDAGKLDNNCGIIDIGKDSIRIAGKDSSKRITEIDNSTGTLFAAYTFLEKCLGVRWIWPGKSGEVIPRHKNLTLAAGRTDTKPVVKSSSWRTIPNWTTEAWKSAKNRQLFFADQTVWMRRHRFSLNTRYINGHAFTGYFQKYGKSDPEFFSMLPDGTRRQNPYKWSKDTRHISMCVSNPKLVQTIVAEYMAGNRKKMLNLNENDTAGECVCEACLKLDNSAISNAERLEKAKKLFAAGSKNWEYDSLGSLSDRYCQFYLAVQKEARKKGIDPEIAGLIYANYSEPPSDKIKLNDRIHLRFCPPYMYPWTGKKIDEYKKIWGGWAKTNAKLMFRPNFTYDGNCFPVQYHEVFYDLFTFSLKNGMTATDMDSYTGHSGAQGLVNYVIARLNHGADVPLAAIEEEFYSSFGKAKAKVREYFGYVTYVSMKVPFKNPLAVRNNEGGQLWLNLFLIADNIFTPPVINKCAKLLNEALNTPGLESEAKERVRILQYGLKNAALTIAAQKEFRKYQAGGPIRPFDEAVKKLDAFRASIEHTPAVNVGMLRRLENRHWHKKLPIHRFTGK